jgi:hypothetical protein
VDVPPQEEVGVPAVLPGPASLPYVAVGLHDAPGGGQQQPEGQIRGGLRQHPRGVAHGNPPGGGGGQVHVVDAHGAARDHAKPGTGLQELRIHRVRQEAEQAIGAPGTLCQGLGRRRALARPDLQLYPRGQPLEGPTGQAA